MTLSALAQAYESEHLLIIQYSFGFILRTYNKGRPFVYVQGALTLGVNFFGHIFSVELGSKKYVKSISISNEARDCVLFERDLGELDGIAFIGSIMLEVRGSNDVLRIDLGEIAMQKVMNKMSQIRA